MALSPHVFDMVITTAMASAVSLVTSNTVDATKIMVSTVIISMANTLTAPAKKRVAMRVNDVRYVTEYLARSSNGVVTL